MSRVKVEVYGGDTDDQKNKRVQVFLTDPKKGKLAVKMYLTASPDYHELIEKLTNLAKLIEV